MSSFIEKCRAASRSCTLFPGQRPLCSHTSSTEARRTVHPVLSQLCTLASNVAQNFSTSCELIRHIFSSFWEDRTRVMSLHLWHSSGLVKQCLYTPNISDECQCSGVHSSLLMRRNILDVSDICVDFICNEGSFIHSSERRGRGWGRTVACSQQLRLAHYRMELNKFFLLETLSNKSFPTSPMNTLAASLID